MRTFGRTGRSRGISVFAGAAVALGLAGTTLGEQTAQPEPTAEEATAPDLSTIEGARVFALELFGGRDEEDEAMSAGVNELRANLRSYRTSGPASDVALIEAALAFDEKDYEDAIEHAERMVELAPRDAEAHYVLGSAIITEVSSGSFGLSTLGKVKRARSAWETAYELDPEHVGARISLAMWHLQAPGIAGGDKDKAAEYGESLVRSGQARWGRRILMLVSFKQDNWDEARARLEEFVAASETDPEKREAYIVYLVEVLIEQERVDDAFDVLPKLASVCEPDDATLHYLYGRAYQERDDRGDRERAIESYAAAIEANPEARDSRWRIAELLRKEDRDSEAAVHYAAFAERFPDHDDAKKAARYAQKLAD